MLKGKHEIKFGWGYRRFETFGFDLAGTNGRYVFNRARDCFADRAHQHRP